MDPCSHVGFQISTKNTNLVEDHPMSNSGKFGSILFCGFREEYLNVKSKRMDERMLTNDKSSHEICVFGADLKSNMAARVHNVFSLVEILKIFLSETTKPIEL
jgi:hypothetical protein